MSLNDAKMTGRLYYVGENDGCNLNLQILISLEI